MTSLFGTDGVRGDANDELTEIALRLSAAAARLLADYGGKPKAVLGRDTRLSGHAIEAAVDEGLRSAGVDVIRVGVLPSAAVAYLTKTLRADLGVMITASHNPASDNGVKFFTRDGYKISAQHEAQIEELLGEDFTPPAFVLPVSSVIETRYTSDIYVPHLLVTLPSPLIARPSRHAECCARKLPNLSGLKVVVDAAHGAAYRVGPEAVRRLGADVITIGVEPDGMNINDGCGSTHLEQLQDAVVEHDADAGLAFDGDADRCIAVDATGNILDGDQILAILAVSLRDRGQLAHNTVVTTEMANLGFKQAMQREGLTVVETAVGDRHVLEAMLSGGFNLGGEQSGHVIMLDHATTGDGVLTGLRLLSCMVETGKSLAELASVVQKTPQVLVNVPCAQKAQVCEAPSVIDAVNAENSKLGDTGRVLVRPSGTEPVIRIMVEAPTEELAEETAQRLVTVIQAESDALIPRKRSHRGCCC